MSYKDVDRTVGLCCLDNCDKWVYNSSDQCVHLWPYCTTQTGHTFTPNLFYQITCPCPLIKILASTKVWVWEERVTRETNVTEETTVWQGGLLYDRGDYCVTGGLLFDMGDYCVTLEITVWQGESTMWCVRILMTARITEWD